MRPNPENTMRSIVSRLAALSVIAVLALSSGGCSKDLAKLGIGVGAAPIQNPVTTGNISDIENAYGLALVGAVAYRELYDTNPCTKTRPFSASNICAKRSVTVKLMDAQQKVRFALDQAYEFIRANPTLNAASYINAAQRAFNVFLNTKSSNGIS